MKEVKSFFLLIEGGFDKSGIGKNEMLIECGIELDIELEWLAKKETFCKVF